MAGVFVSYRRDDSQGFAGRLTDDLSDILGDERVFRDIEIPIGSDFTQVLERAIAASDVLLVVIGRAWARRGHAGYGDRLFEPTDWVRTEIESAFSRRKHVIPVLVGGASMPTADALPESIRQLVVLQAATLTDRHWDDEVAALAARIRVLCPHLAEDTGVGSGGFETLADVLRDLGDHLIGAAADRRPGFPDRDRHPVTGPARRRPLWQGLGRFAGSALLLVAAYVGLRLFGDREILEMLDAVEARLGAGWERLQGYWTGHAST
jgi:hypothetical protein